MATLNPDDQATEEIVRPLASAAAAPTPSTPFIPSPFSFLFTRDDRLLLTTWCSASSVIVGLSGRRQDPSGEFRPFLFTHTPNNDRSGRAELFNPGEGYLLNLTAFAFSGTFYYGQLFAKVEVVRGDTSVNRIVLGTLAQGYLGRHDSQAWPGSVLRASLEGDGVARQLFGTDPAAGAEISELVPNGAQWTLMAFGAQLVTDGTVVNRQPDLQFRSGTEQLHRSLSPSVLGASASARYTWGNGHYWDPSVAATVRAGSLGADIPLIEGQRIATVTTNLQAGDNWGAPIMNVREWLAVSSPI